MPWCHSLVPRNVLGTLLVTVVPSGTRYKSTRIPCTTRIYEVFRTIGSSSGSKFVEMSSIIMIKQTLYNEISLIFEPYIYHVLVICQSYIDHTFIIYTNHILIIYKYIYVYICAHTSRFPYCFPTVFWNTSPVPCGNPMASWNLGTVPHLLRCSSPHGVVSTTKLGKTASLRKRVVFSDMFVM